MTTTAFVAGLRTDVVYEHELVMRQAFKNPPRFVDYVGPVVEFFRAHEDDPAFVPGASTKRPNLPRK